VPDTASFRVSQVLASGLPASDVRDFPVRDPAENSHTGENMKKLFGSLLLAMFLCVSGGYALGAPKQDPPKQDEAKKDDMKKDDKAKDKKKAKKDKKKDEKKDETKKPS
jgi:hypothetical protein